MGQSMQPLSGKSALVTGASSGIGRATALALAQAGADVAFNYLTYPNWAEELAGQIQSLSRRVLLFPADVADQVAVEAMINQTAQGFGGLDIFVANAFYSDEALFHLADMAGFRRTIDVTMWGAFYGVRAAAQQMIHQGRGGNIIVFSSPPAHQAMPSSQVFQLAKS